MTAPPVPYPDRVRIEPGPVLLDGLADGPGLAAHRDCWGSLPRPGLDALLETLDAVGVRGRGGAGFPFAVKLRTAAEAPRRPVVVVNLGEGEPASAKDHALATTRPHLVLDGAALVAHALGAREIHLVLPGERPDVRRAVRTAVAERPERFEAHLAEPRFVAGQSAAALELIGGRPNLPVTTWVPQAVAGHRGRPTLLSNAETWAQVAVLAHRGATSYAAHGTAVEPGTTLLTLVTTRGDHRVVEVPHGARWRDVLAPDRVGRPALVGGFHGAWVTGETLASATVSPARMRALGAPLGAGVVLTISDGECPLQVTAAVTGYLAGQSAGRCGPCRNGLPALAAAVDAVAGGDARPATLARVRELDGMVTGRGACAHPDGTTRLVRSALATFPACVAGHAPSACPAAAPARPVRALRAVS